MLEFFSRDLLLCGSWLCFAPICIATAFIGNSVQYPWADNLPCGFLRRASTTRKHFDLCWLQDNLLRLPFTRTQDPKVDQKVRKHFLSTEEHHLCLQATTKVNTPPTLPPNPPCCYMCIIHQRTSSLFAIIHRRTASLFASNNEGGYPPKPPNPPIEPKASSREGILRMHKNNNRAGPLIARATKNQSL